MTADYHPPQEVLRRVRREHAEIRELISRVEQLSQEVEAGDQPAIATLRDQLRTLGRALREHLHFEEYQLGAFVELNTEAGQAALKAMQDDHAAQRKLLEDVIGDLDECATGQRLVVGARELARAIRDDMNREEANFP